MLLTQIDIKTKRINISNLLADFEKGCWNEIEGMNFTLIQLAQHEIIQSKKLNLPLSLIESEHLPRISKRFYSIVRDPYF